jgi:hypothetical protein
MNYTSNQDVTRPTAHITKKKSRLKVYNGHVVFLDNNDNFEFELHNPKQNSVLVKIKLNGEYISSSGVVLRPGQRMFLERFLDTNNKFEFSTYEVNNTSENRNAIELNGDVRIEFYDEQIIYNSFLSLGSTSTGAVYRPWTQNIMGGVINTCHTTTNDHGITFSTNSLNTSSTFTSSSSQPVLSSLSTKSIETGRVEKGEKSNQSFTNSYEQFNSYTSHQISFKIKPLSGKNKTSQDIRQYCEECGTKVKSNYKFCPTCGNDLTKPKETKIKYTENSHISVNGRQYLMQTYNITLDKLIENNQGKTIVIHKPSLSEDYLRAIIY